MQAPVEEPTANRTKRVNAGEENKKEAQRWAVPAEDEVLGLQSCHVMPHFLTAYNTEGLAEGYEP